MPPDQSAAAGTEPTARQPVAHTEGPMLRRITVAASIGSLIEYFDLVVYGALAVVLSRVFFPGADDTARLLQTFAVFAVAFVARPLGGLFWGPLGDRIGRKKTLSAIIILMAMATALIGLLPSYAAIGVLAPIALVLLRFIQGISAGGEVPGAATFVAEHTRDSRRAFQCSFLQWGVTTGQITALLFATLLMSTLSEAQMDSWGWRIPFLVALPMGLIGLYIRSKVGETPEFEKVEDAEVKLQSPLRSVLGTREAWKMLGSSQFFNLPASIPAYLLLTFIPAYLVSELRLPSGQALLAVTVAVVVAMIMQPLAAMASDRFGRRPMLLATCLVQIVVAYPAFMLMQSGGGTMLLPALGLIIIGVVHGVATGCQAAPTLESFPTRFRYTGYALSLGLSTALLAGPTPYIATWLISATGNDYAPAWLIIGAATPSIVGFFFLRETANRPLPT